MIAAALAALLAAPLGAQRPALPPERLALARELRQVRISPDGRQVAFVTDISGALELWTVPAEGGWPEQLSALGEQAGELRYGHDGRWLYFVSDFGGDERGDLYRVEAQGGEVENLTRSTAAERSPRPSPDGKRLAYLADPGRPFLFQLMLLDLGAGESRRLTEETVSVHGPVWSPDGKSLAAFRSGDDHKGDLLLIDVESGESRVLPPPTAGGLIIPEQFGSLSRNLLCRARNEKGFLQLYLLDVGTGRGRFLGPGDWDVEAAVYHPTAGIFFTRNEGGVFALYRLKDPAGEPEPLLRPQGFIESFDVDDAGRRLAFVRGDSRHAPDAWVLELGSGLLRRLSRSMPAGLRPEGLARARFIRYKSFDEETIHALYLAPTVRRLGSPPPVVVDVHGGPDWQVFDEFDPLRQALAEAGFAVLAPNFRGSTGYGKRFAELNRKDWGGGDRRDILAGVRHLAALGEIDPKRAGIMGGSYGGYMTLFSLARDPEQWAAGVAAYGMPDLALDYELTKDRFADWYRAQMGSPESDPKLFRDRSPIHHIDALKAPLLLFQGANDTNVPPEEARLVYDKLKALGRPVELVVYPDEGHGFTKRKNRLDHHRRVVDFFTRHLSPR